MKGFEDRRSRAHPGQGRLGRPVLRAVPLVAVWCHVARERRVRRHELGVRQQRCPVGRQPDQIIAVGPQPVQQDDEAARLAARSGRARRSGQERHHQRGLSKKA